MRPHGWQVSFPLSPAVCKSSSQYSQADLLLLWGWLASLSSCSKVQEIFFIVVPQATVTSVLRLDRHPITLLLLLSQINFHPFYTLQNCYFSRLFYIYYCTSQVVWTKYTFHTEMVSNVHGSFFFLTFNLLIGWQLSIWNCCHPFFSLLYNCQLLCFWWLALSIAVQVLLQSFFSRYCSFKDVYCKLVMPNCMPYPWVASIFFKFLKVIFLLSSLKNFTIRYSICPFNFLTFFSSSMFQMHLRPYLHFFLFHNATFFGSCVIHLFHTGCAKI